MEWDLWVTISKFFVIGCLASLLLLLAGSTEKYGFKWYFDRIVGSMWVLAIVGSAVYIVWEGTQTRYFL